jgi:hypothetical protein
MGARVAAVLALATLLGASPAWAGQKIYAPAGKTVYAPPGKAGASEYSETIPTSGGNVSPPNQSSFTGSSAAKTASDDPIAKLGAGTKGLISDAKQGNTGQQAAGFAQSTAPVVVTEVSSAGAKGAVSGIGSDSGSAAGAVLHLLGGGDAGGIGVLLPLVLAFTLGLACALIALRGRPPRA